MLIPALFVLKSASIGTLIAASQESLRSLDGAGKD